MTLTLEKIISEYVLNACGCFLLITGVVIFGANKLRAANKAFSVLVILGGFWMINSGFIARREESVIINLRLGAILASGLVFTMPYIVEAILKPRFGLRWHAPNLRGWLLFSVILAVMTLSDSFIAWDSPKLLPNYGLMWIVQHALIALAMSYMVYRSRTVSRVLDSVRRRELVYTVSITSLAIGTISTSLCFLPLIRPVPKAELGVFVVLLTCGIAWGLLVRGVYSFAMLLRIFLKNFAAILVGIIVFALIFWISQTLVRIRMTGAMVLAIAGAVLAGNLVFKYFVSNHNALLYHSIADFQMSLTKIVEECVEGEQASRAMSAALARVSGTEAVFFSKEMESATYYFTDDVRLNAQGVHWEPMRESTWVTSEYLLDSDVALEATFQTWASGNHVSLLMLSSPSLQKSNLCVAFGRRLNSYGYTFEELERLSVLVDSVALAVTNVEVGEQARQAGKAMAIGLVSASVLHEVKQPLAALKLFMKLLPSEYSDPGFRKEYFGLIVGEVNRIEQYLLDLLSFGGSHKFNIQTIDPALFVRETVQLLRHKTEANKIAISVESAENNNFIRCDIGVLKQAMLNILLNAIDSLKESVAENRAITVSFSDNGENVSILVSDNGPGISKEILTRLFRPFVTSKDNGNGLGLYITKDLISRCGGNIEAYNRQPGGACFVIRFPLIQGG